jgi:hypothetical protein
VGKFPSGVSFQLFSKGFIPVLLSLLYFLSLSFLCPAQSHIAFESYDIILKSYDDKPNVQPVLTSNHCVLFSMGSLGSQVGDPYLGNAFSQPRDPARGYYPDYERPILVPRSFGTSSSTSKLAFLRKPAPIDVGSYEPVPKPRPQEQTGRDPPIPNAVDKPVGYYLVLQRPSRSRAEERSKSLPSRKAKSAFAFGCLPNKKPRAGPSPEPEVVQKKPTPRMQRTQPPPPIQPRSVFAYYPTYEAPPATYLKTSERMPVAITQNTTEIRRNPRGQYPDYRV